MTMTKAVAILGKKHKYYHHLFHTYSEIEMDFPKTKISLIFNQPRAQDEHDSKPQYGFQVLGFKV